MHIPEKITIYKKLSPWRYGQLKTLLPAVGRDQSGDADRGTAALVNHTVRVEYGLQEMCCSWPHRVVNDQLTPTCPWSFT